MLKAAAEGFGATDIQDLKRLVERLLIVLNRPVGQHLMQLLFVSGVYSC